MVIRHDPPYQFTAKEIFQLLADCNNLDELQVSSEGKRLHGLKDILSHYLASRSIVILPKIQTITVAYCEGGKTLVWQGRHTFSPEQIHEMKCLSYRFYQES